MNSEQLLNTIKNMVIKCKGNGESDKCFADILSYAKYVSSWGKTHNVTAKNNIEMSVIENIYDSIAPWSKLENELLLLDYDDHIIDAGSGGGFPGFILSFLFENNKFWLVDVNRKKCSLLIYAKSLLSKGNVLVVNKDFKKVKKSKLLVTKAMCSPPSSHLLLDAVVPGGKIIIWAAEEMNQEFKDNIEKHGGKFRERFPYESLKEQKRNLLIFSKEQ